MIKIKEVTDRDNRRQSSRYGVSLVAGHPFSQETISRLTGLQETISDWFPKAFAYVPAKHLHSTILRSKSSKRELDEFSKPRSQFENLLTNLELPELVFTTINVETDGAVRVHIEPTSPIVEDNIGDQMAGILSSTYSYSIHRQDQLWVTLADLRPSYINRVDPYWISEELNPLNIENENLSHLSLVYYKDVHFNDTTLIQQYNL